MKYAIPPLLLLMITQLSHAQAPAAAVNVDVCVYAATPGGILAAIAVAREGRSVIIVEPSRWVGGMLGAGLKPLQDCPNYAATGGLTHQLLPRLGSSGGSLNDKDPRALNPKVIRDDFAALLKEHNIRVLFEHRLARCVKDGAQVSSAIFDQCAFDELGCPIPKPVAKDALTVQAHIFIDASYEADFLPLAGISFRVGRESATEFGEPHSGVQPAMELAPIDPFIIPGQPDSGLLNLIDQDHGKPVGSADQYTQAYNYRYYTTSDPAHRIAITPPENYSPQDYELVGRYVQHLTNTIHDPQLRHKKLVGIFPGWLNSGEWNYQRDSLISMAPLGISQHYANGDIAAQARVWKEHQNYLRGLHHFMSTDSRVPESYRQEVTRLGLDARPHPETGGWPHQLYIRVARRLAGSDTITAHDVYNETQITDPIALAQYGIDTYPSRRIVVRQGNETLVGIEGKMFVGGSKGPTNIPYPIPYRAITPHENECTNLLVPVCFSATHLGYASARMEPAFMICGESAGIAACQAMRENKPVQQIDAATFQQALLQAGQKLTWNPATDGVSPEKNSTSEGRTTAVFLSECDANLDGVVSVQEWNIGKPGWEWLFASIDTNKNGQIDSNEYTAFQKFKADHPDWQSRLKAKKTVDN